MVQQQQTRIEREGRSSSTGNNGFGSQSQVERLNWGINVIREYLSGDNGPIILKELGSPEILRRYILDAVDFNKPKNLSLIENKGGTALEVKSEEDAKYKCKSVLLESPEPLRIGITVNPPQKINFLDAELTRGIITTEEYNGLLPFATPNADPGYLLRLIILNEVGKNGEFDNLVETIHSIYKLTNRDIRPKHSRWAKARHNLGLIALYDVFNTEGDVDVTVKNPGEMPKHKIWRILPETKTGQAVIGRVFVPNLPHRPVS